ncbi:MAG: CoA pyrophosphatase [Deltaproteobacteria bacterium]|nr:CoA pyrophosphatase [Deltaproteobacteria bacterium]
MKVPDERNFGRAGANFFIETLRQLLTVRPVKTIVTDGSELKHAGVLIPVLLEDEIWKILLTRRSKRVAHHKGQISFPGGAVDGEDQTYEETALRETFEEIGVAREQIEVLGRMDDIQTVASRFIIHPFVGHIFEGNRFFVNTQEVDGILKIPLAFLFKADSHEEKCTVTYEGKIYETAAYRYHEDLIWGATAGIIKNLVHILGDKIDLLQEKK